MSQAAGAHLQREKIAASGRECRGGASFGREGRGGNPGGATGVPLDSARKVDFWKCHVCDLNLGEVIDNVDFTFSPPEKPGTALPREDPPDPGVNALFAAGDVHASKLIQFSREKEFVYRSRCPRRGTVVAGTGFKLPALRLPPNYPVKNKWSTPER